MMETETWSDERDCDREGAQIRQEQRERENEREAQNWERRTRGRES